MKARFLHAVLGAVLLALCFLSLRYGTVAFSLRDVLRGLCAGPFSHDTVAQIVWNLRMPRLLLALAAGWVTARSGLLLQVATGNALADPYLFGLSSGAATGAIASLMFLTPIFGGLTTFVGAMIGSMVATGLLLALVLVRNTRRTVLSPVRLILGGIAISFLFTTCTDLLVYAGDRNTAHALLFWTMGSFAVADWSILPITLIGIVLLGFFNKFNHQKLDALRAGDDTARSLGVDTKALRVWTLIICALSCATVVAISGPVPFIGLTVPHLVRATGRDTLLMLTFLTGTTGAAFAVGADIVGRVLLPAQEIPVGVIVSAFGSLFLGLMVAKGRV